MTLRQSAKASRFEEMIAPHEKKVYFTCLQMMGNKEDAEDCAQEALLKAFHKLDSFDGRSLFSTWLYTLTTRVCLDALRKRKDVFSLEAMQETGFEPQDEQMEAYLLLEEKERKAALRHALKELPVDFRAAIVLVDLQGLQYKEAAQALDIPEGTVKSRVNRARGMLHKILLTNRELFTASDRPNDERRNRQ